VPTTWITNVPCAGGCKTASQDTCSRAGAAEYGKAVQFLAIVRLHQRRKGLTYQAGIAEVALTAVLTILLHALESTT
jgi:hypothetical protein